MLAKTRLERLEQQRRSMLDSQADLLPPRLIDYRALIDPDLQPAPNSFDVVLINLNEGQTLPGGEIPIITVRPGLIEKLLPEGWL